MSASPAPTDDHIYTVKETSLIGECIRKWAAKYRHRLPDPKHPAAQAGIDVHAVLERMLRQGPAANVNPETEIGGWARALYPMAPPGCHAELESPFELEFAGEPDTYRSSFRIDFVFPDFSGFGDWKTCAGERWSVTDLTNDLQANLEAYGFAKVMGFPPDRPVQLLWLYVDKKTRKAWRVPGALSFAQARAWLRVNALPRLRLIRALRALPVQPISAYPHDITACGGSGRNCAFLGACQFKPSTANLTTETLYQLASK